jgi:hypothetical protein
MFQLDIRKTTVIAVILLANALPSASRADNSINSGNAYIRGCEDFISESTQDEFKQGKCIGAMHVIYFYSSYKFGYCPPEGSNVGQAVRIVLKYMSQHPEILHQDFAELAVLALQEAWPCRR